MAKLIILAGLPGSGKSSYAKELCSNNTNTIHMSSDVIRKELYGDENVQQDNNKVFRILQHRTISHLKDGKDVVYDATNVNRKNRKMIIQAATGVGAIIECHIVWAPLQTCILRDLARSRTVGEKVINKFLYRWETPFYDEGIDKIVIHITDKKHVTTDYRKELIAQLNIEHDNPHHTLSVIDHSWLAYHYAKEKDYSETVTMAALWHDCGKPLTKFFKDGSSIAHFYQHDNVGGYLSLGLYTTTERSDIIEISWLISNHMQHYFESKYYEYLHPRYRDMLDDLGKADIAAH